MPIITAAIDPVTRIEGHLKVEVKIDTVQGSLQVVDAFSTGTLFRGFEKILEQRDPRDAPLITSRICGVCPTSHAMASVLALDKAFSITGDSPQRTSSRLIRNLVHGACFIESSLLHFYLLSLPDYVPAPGVGPWLPAWDFERRLDAAGEKKMTEHFLEAVRMRRLAHEMGAIFGGKLPHTPALVAGGVTSISSAEDKVLFAEYLNTITQFIENVYIPDSQTLASYFPEYCQWGKGCGNLMSFGVFEMDNGDAPQWLLKPGVYFQENSAFETLDTAQILEHVTHSWYAQSGGPANLAKWNTEPVNPKPNAYSWLKAPRYKGRSFECGSLARMWIHGEYRGGISVMDRHIARAMESRKIALAMKDWLAQLVVGQSGYILPALPEAASAAGLTEAPRGALGHWISIENNVISKYQVITPTCWNLSPRDDADNRGPLEQALIGVPVLNPDKPIEVLRVIHSYDPCLDCATHVLRIKK